MRLKNGKRNRSLNIGFISTRFRGLDGVSLEAEKWASVLREFKHHCFWFAGELDRDPQASLLIPEAFFGHPSALELNRTLFGTQKRNRQMTEALHRQKDFLKDKLYEFIHKFRIDLIIPENALSIPMHLPLGMAITELIAETGIPTIAHHHDFYWERPRFLMNACQDILNMAFPPDLPSIKHVVINSMARAELAARRSIAASLIFNVMDFEKKPSKMSGSDRQFRKDLGFKPDDILILQPTRVVYRKGIEQAIYLVQLLNMPKVRLIVSHSLGDEGPAYTEWVKEWGKRQGVPLHFIYNRLHEENRFSATGEKLYSLWDVYPHMDLITYPSIYEGFGNAFLEAVYFKKPILMNRYSVFIVDIEPKGFDVVAIDGYLTDTAVRQVTDVLMNSNRRKEMVDRNFELARKYFSFQILRKELANLISSFFGLAPPQGLIRRLFRWA
ncbi:MAG: glycosyltransferase family 4 protein [Spirochaetota bacterium]